MTMLQETKMNLHIASHPGRRETRRTCSVALRERIGDIDVLVISDGVLPLPTKMLAHNADPAERAAWLDDMFLPSDASTGH